MEAERTDPMAATAAPPLSPVSMEVDESNVNVMAVPTTPKFSPSDSDLVHNPSMGFPEMVPVVTPDSVASKISSAPKIVGRAAESGSAADADEARDAAILLTALSAIATKEVHVDGVTDLLFPPPLPNLAAGAPDRTRSDQGASSGIAEEEKIKVPSFRHLRSAFEAECKQRGRHPAHHPRFSEPQPHLGEALRVRAVSMDAALHPPSSSEGMSAEAAMKVASDLVLPCEPCYQEEEEEGQQDRNDERARAASPTSMTAAALVSPPSSPAFRPRNGVVGGGGGRSADRRKRYLDSHAAEFQLTGAATSSPPSLPPSSAADGPSPSSAAGGPASSTLSSSPSSGELPSEHKGTLQPPNALKGRVVKTILRKKFSWKNYPELERFLIANREEYLRHSALNYTVQQKRYNNRLTERLLQLATEHGYVFDEADFSFVTVRDRIRCYFKSYVQSSKKRGVVVGYAARRAGLLSRDELERSAGSPGRIVVPGRD